MDIRPSRVLEILRSGGLVSCFKLNLSCPRAAEIAAALGFDCIWTDMEHTATDLRTVESMIWATKSQNRDLMVRVPRGSYSDYIKPLELDASGIMVPHIMSLEDAKRVVRTTRFHPIGLRPVDGGNADAMYCNHDFVQYLGEANDQRFLMIQIEDPEPLDELDAIASLEGIDIIFFGPGDFGHGIGAPGVWDHPRVKEVRKLVAEAALRHGKFAGTMGNPGNIDELIDLGYRFINMGTDIIGLNSYCKDLVGEFDKRR